MAVPLPPPAITAKYNIMALLVTNPSPLMASALTPHKLVMASTSPHKPDSLLLSFKTLLSLIATHKPLKAPLSITPPLPGASVTSAINPPDHIMSQITYSYNLVLTYLPPPAILLPSSSSLIVDFGPSTGKSDSVILPEKMLAGSLLWSPASMVKHPITEIIHASVIIPPHLTLIPFTTPAIGIKVTPSLFALSLVVLMHSYWAIFIMDLIAHSLTELINFLSS